MSDHPHKQNPPVDKEKHLFDDPKNIKRVIHGLYGVCVVAIFFEFLVYRHVDHPWETVFGFYGLYGFGACVVLVLIAKEMRKFIMRKEDYYDE